MSSDFRPMSGTAIKDDGLDTLKFPVLVSYKLDGIRCVIRNGVPISRNMKCIRNKHITAALTGLPEFDGELVCGGPPHKDQSNPEDDVLSRSNSGVMSANGEPEFTYYVFDMHMEAEFRTRLNEAQKAINAAGNANVAFLPHYLCFDANMIRAHEETALRLGYEGLIIRDPLGPYKYGKATAKEATFLKLKRFDDYEARVSGYLAKNQNTNAPTIAETGLTKRSKKKGGMVAKDTLGTLLGTMVTGPYAGAPMRVGSGFDDALRKYVWNIKADIIGTLFKFKCQGFTPDGEPRFPVFISFRDEADMEVEI